MAAYSDAFDGITDTGAQTREQPASVTSSDRQEQRQAERRVIRLIKKHGCWTDEDPKPEGVIAGHAIVTQPGADTVAEYVPADVGFGMWLGPDDEEKTGDEDPGTPHAFCP